MVTAIAVSLFERLLLLIDASTHSLVLENSNNPKRYAVSVRIDRNKNRFVLLIRIASGRCCSIVATRVHRIALENLLYYYTWLTIIIFDHNRYKKICNTSSVVWSYFRYRQVPL